mmetsp:Transcript_34669/g.77540  ORF Transcript_34669/g.77540 Transcript_34669/m.77540 type:complete len:237 (-) Transcript_34669:21-731(-)
MATTCLGKVCGRWFSCHGLSSQRRGQHNASSCPVLPQLAVHQLGHAPKRSQCHSGTVSLPLVGRPENERGGVHPNGILFRVTKTWKSTGPRSRVTRRGHGTTIFCSHLGSANLATTGSPGLRSTSRSGPSSEQVAELGSPGASAAAPQPHSFRNSTTPRGCSASSQSSSALAPETEVPVCTLQPRGSQTSRQLSSRDNPGGTPSEDGTGASSQSYSSDDCGASDDSTFSSDDDGAA